MNIEISKVNKMDVPEYAFEAEVVGLGDHASYFYGHSREEVLAKILAYMLEKANG